MIIIPTKWLFHWGYTLFSDIPKLDQLNLGNFSPPASKRSDKTCCFTPGWFSLRLLEQARAWKARRWWEPGEGETNLAGDWEIPELNGHLNRKYLNIIKYLYNMNFSIYTNAELCSKQCLISKGYVSHVFTWLHFFQLHFKALSINMHLEHPGPQSRFSTEALGWASQGERSQLFKGPSYHESSLWVVPAWLLFCFGFELKQPCQSPPKRKSGCALPKLRGSRGSKSSSSSWTPLSRSTSSTFVNVVNVTSRTNGRLVSSVPVGDKVCWDT